MHALYLGATIDIDVVEPLPKFMAISITYRLMTDI